MDNNENEHLIFRKFHRRQHLAKNAPKWSTTKRNYLFY